MGALDSLVELAASDNHIASLPASLGTGCRALRVLNLRYNQLNALPSALAARGSLQLQLSGNPLERRATSPDRVADGCRPVVPPTRRARPRSCRRRIAALEVQEEQLRVESEQSAADEASATPTPRRRRGRHRRVARAATARCSSTTRCATAGGRRAAGSDRRRGVAPPRSSRRAAAARGAGAGTGGACARRRRGAAPTRVGAPAGAARRRGGAAAGDGSAAALRQRCASRRATATASPPLHPSPAAAAAAAAAGLIADGLNDDDASLAWEVLQRRAPSLLPAFERAAAEAGVPTFGEPTRSSQLRTGRAGRWEGARGGLLPRRRSAAGSPRRASSRQWRRTSPTNCSHRAV